MPLCQTIKNPVRAAHLGNSPGVKKCSISALRTPPHFLPVNISCPPTRNQCPSRPCTAGFDPARAWLVSLRPRHAAVITAMRCRSTGSHIPCGAANRYHEAPVCRRLVSPAAAMEQPPCNQDQIRLACHQTAERSAETRIGLCNARSAGQQYASSSKGRMHRAW